MPFTIHANIAVFVKCSVLLKMDVSPNARVPIDSEARTLGRLFITDAEESKKKIEKN
jgi:hypothetical protein